ncbi:cation:dicarboxylase symporter family transporter [Corynebacterium sp. 4HC-13]|uniref:dicarboxylate/amino acid:cation symporter n=1 Tax=Corynebacterium anserum TaxID=2684406 RepID=UPI00163B11EF|nr:dicarboxylate/amino acid:cation symporter [Corynebacterium anserum]MBC2682125.1 cation:dicarboxylase symporter family transporter [Corynebacterium anserum]
MSSQRFTHSLLFKIIVAIILGIVCSLFFPAWAGRIFATLNGLFGNFLGFFVPVLIFALITPAIANLGKGAGKWLGITTGIAYGSTIFSGLIAYATSVALYPTLLAGQSVSAASDIEEGALSPFFKVEMAPPMEVMTALLLSFCVGLAMTAVPSDSLLRGANQLREVVMKVIENFIIPLLPIYIFGIFVTMGMNGNLVSTISMFLKVLVVAIVGTLILLFIQYLLTGLVTGANPLKALKNMLPAYATALGTSSSAATIPVTYKSALKNGVTESVAGFVIPLCATIHLAGSMMKIVLFAFAVMYMSGEHVSPGLAIGFILMLGVTMIAAPGVPGGAIMAAVGLLTSMLGFTDEQVALMIAAYIAIDSFGTAANVTGDGAIAMVVNKFARGNLKASSSAKRSSDAF